MPHTDILYREQEAGNSNLNNQYLNEIGLTNLSEIQSQQTQNVVADLAVSGESNLKVLAMD